ncbi:MAG: hypothetical protein WAT81_05410 [Candidatus Moraniibacteriota bacterium]
MKIEKNGLEFLPQANGFVCTSLRNLGEVFVQTNDASLVRGAIDSYVDLLRGMATAAYPNQAARNAVPEAERDALGKSTFDGVVATLKSEASALGLFESFFFWLSLWWYYHPELTRQVMFPDRSAISTRTEEILTTFLLPALPEPIRRTVAEMELSAVASNFGHFALLFVDNDQSVRRIVTDTGLYELHGVGGYRYLDITKEGLPVARSTCRRGGERAFFDGVRLMSHDRFQTCAPATVMIDGGYKVNSTECTIVNGQLFDLIDVDDKVAHTTGAWLGMVDFTRYDAANAIEIAKRSAEYMQVKDGVVMQDGGVLQPKGVFQPSHVTLLESGFALYQWSEFSETPEK